ncbi:MAG: 1-(5-phosphoribosyl)-5-amino-4-imidazole-carboxylate carboxylase, partial [Bacteroidetes bacterium]|nr:1-(5-phosphoribosyl)-5-amino-4-imidazole-carboxylate carboxylase [Bacteroidota bacterium]
MNPKDILKNYKNGKIDLTDALGQLSDKGVEELGFANIDTDRLSRTGLPEVIYASGKTVE